MRLGTPTGGFAAFASINETEELVPLHHQHLACSITLHFIVGMTKSAPERMPVGQRDVMVFSRV
jgi:hypothetical protein